MESPAVLPPDAARSNPDAGTGPAGPLAFTPRGERTRHDAVQWIFVGGGADAVSTQWSLWLDAQLAQRALAPRVGWTLFAAGAGSPVWVGDRRARGDALLQEIARTVDPRSDRDGHAVTADGTVDGAADADSILGAVREAVAQTGPPLLVYVAMHGDRGDAPGDARLIAWGDRDLDVRALARALDAVPAARPVRFVMTSCFGGGFADVVFRGASAGPGTVVRDRCGLFASTWDREAAGCDPDPDRSAHQGYGVHFLHALQSEDREGHPIDRRTLDLDGDGTVGLLEAHTRARIASTSFDVPTTTSERWLEVAVGPLPVDAAMEAMPVEIAVVRALAPADATPTSVRLRLDAIRQRDDALERERAPLADALADREAARTSGLLARWPGLADPWHPDFAPTLARHRAEIAAYLATPSSAVGEAADRARVEALEDEQDQLDVEAARLLRVQRAYETMARARLARSQGGNTWRTFLALRACERLPP